MVVLVRPSSVKQLAACVGVVVERAFSLIGHGHKPCLLKGAGAAGQEKSGAGLCSRLHCAGGPLTMGGCWRAGPLQCGIHGSSRHKAQLGGTHAYMEPQIPSTRDWPCVDGVSCPG